MSEFTVYPSKLSGQLTIPPSKSHCLRALLFSMLGSGTTKIHHFLDSLDTETMIQAMSLFGTKVDKKGKDLEIQGRFCPPEDVIHAGNSGKILHQIVTLSLEEFGVTLDDPNIGSEGVSNKRDEERISKAKRHSHSPKPKIHQMRK